MKMKVEDGVRVHGRRNVVVGIRIDTEGKAIVNYVVAQVAGPGDRVLVVHVCRHNDQICKNKPLLESCLEEYRNLGNSKKVDLRGEVLAGNSIRKVLVKEAKKCEADVMVLGIKHPTGLRGWTSKARYCTNHLPPTTNVLAIHNGKVVLRRCSDNQLPGFKDYVMAEFGDSEVETETESGSGDSFKDPKSVLHKRGPTRSISFLNMSLGDLSEKQPGWPLLQSAASLHPQTIESRNMSVVEWVMSLPNRFPLDRAASDIIDKNNVVSASGSVPKTLEQFLEHNSSGWRWFSLDVLRTATCQFSEENLIGKGGSNRVYKGTLPDGKPVAVKVLKTSTEAQSNFSLELDIISSLKHNHITRLLGICINNNDLISVYEFYSKGSLDENLHGKNKDKSSLPWDARFKVAVEIAEALNYLHNEAPRVVIHRDVKSSNILLSSGFESQLSDFGLAIWGPENSCSMTQDNIVGTFGYLAPEYFMYGKVSDKVDVYAFGVVLLELLSGREPISSENPKSQESLVMWAKPLMEIGDLKAMVDPNLEGNFNDDQVERMGLAATLCITQAARLRPKMSQILKLLCGDIDIEQLVCSQSAEDSDQQDENDDEVYPTSSAESHLSLALLDVEDGCASFSSMDQSNNVSSNLSLEDYFKDKVLSRSSSFN